MQGDVIKLLQFSLDGHGYVGKGYFKEPDITFKTESDENDFIGLDQIVGVNALSASMTLTEFAPETLKLLGICSGNRKRFIGRGSFDTPDCTAKSYKVTVEGLITEIPGAEIKPGRFSNREFKLGSIIYYRLEIGGEVIWEIDRNNHVFTVNGNDQMAQHRTNAGL